MFKVITWLPKCYHCKTNDSDLMWKEINTNSTSDSNNTYYLCKTCYNKTLVSYHSPAKELLLAIDKLRKQVEKMV